VVRKRTPATLNTVFNYGGWLQAEAASRGRRLMRRAVVTRTEQSQISWCANFSGINEDAGWEEVAGRNDLCSD